MLPPISANFPEETVIEFEDEFPDDLELIRRYREKLDMLDIGTDPFESVQRPTCTNIRIRSLSDACVIFHAVFLKLLPMVTRRLDTEERRLITPGSCYVWEERRFSSTSTNSRNLLLIYSLLQVVLMLS